MLVRDLGSNILDILYPPRVTRERYRAVIGRLNRRIRDLRSEIIRLQAAIVRLQARDPVSSRTGSVVAMVPANDNGRPRGAILKDRR